MLAASIEVQLLRHVIFGPAANAVQTGSLEFLTVPLLLDTTLRMLSRISCGFAPAFYVGRFHY